MAAPAASAGTVAVIDVADQAVTVAALAPMLTVLVPWVAPKFVPAMVTELPTGPEAGVSAEMVGTTGTVTVKAAAFEATPPTVTVTLTAPAPRAGTVAVIEVALHEVTVAVVAPMLTVLVPWVAPKFVPVMVTALPARPEVGLSEAMVGDVLLL